MKKNEIIQDIKVDKLIFGWKWLALAPDWKKIILWWWVVPWSVISVRILKIRNNYYEWQMVDLIKKSPLEVDLPGHFQVYWWCKWLPIRYEDQLNIKNWQVKEAFNHIKEFVAEDMFHPIVSSPEIYWYRNKVEFSWWKYISEKEWVHDEYRFWFHKQGEFDRIIDCSFCVLADDEINSIFKEIDTYARNSNLPTYDPKRQSWFWRHLVVRKAQKTKEIMLVFSINSNHQWYNRDHEWKLKIFTNYLARSYPNIKSIYLLYNIWKADIVQWDAEKIYWEEVIREELLGKIFEINPKSFFQTNSLWAEKLYSEAIELALKWKPNFYWDVMLDLYAWTGTLWILFSPHFKKVYSVEIVKEASKDWERNAKLNWISNIEFINEKAEVFLKDFVEWWGKADLLVIDPPRDWMHPSALPNIISFDAKVLIYVSCNPSTLTRDLDFMLKNSDYRITDIIPVDMFPHTHHIETVVRLEKK